MNASHWFSVIGLLLACGGAVLAALWGTMTPSTVIVASSPQEFQRKQRNIVRSFRYGLLMLAAGTVLQIVGTCLAR